MAGPWALDRIRESGIPYAITNFPAGPAGEGYPFSGVQTILINAQSENKLLAETFLTDYVATEEIMTALYEKGQRPSAYLPVLEKLDDPDLLAFGEAGKCYTYACHSCDGFRLDKLGCCGCFSTRWQDDTGRGSQGCGWRRFAT